MIKSNKNLINKNCLATVINPSLRHHLPFNIQTYTYTYTYTRMQHFFDTQLIVRAVYVSGDCLSIAYGIAGVSLACRD